MGKIIIRGGSRGKETGEKKGGGIKRLRRNGLVAYGVTSIARLVQTFHEHLPQSPVS